MNDENGRNGRVGYFDAARVISIYWIVYISQQMTHHDPYNGDVFVFMSKDRRKVKMVHFENHAYYIHEKVFTDGYSFMLLEYCDEKGMKSYRMDWKDLVAVLESPVVKKLRLK